MRAGHRLFNKLNAKIKDSDAEGGGSGCIKRKSLPDSRQAFSELQL